MKGSDFMDEIDCGSFFDQIDDLIDFPTDNDCGLGSGNCNDFPIMWSNSSDGLPDSDPIFSGNHSNSGSDLSAELAVPYEDIIQLEWLSNFVEDSFAGGGMTFVKDNSPVKKESSPQNLFQTSSPISVLESSSSSSSCSGGKTVPPLCPSHCGPQRARSKRTRPAAFGPQASIQLVSPTSSVTDTPHSFPAPVASSQFDNFAESHHPLKKIPKPASAEEPKRKKKVKRSVPLGSGETDPNLPSHAVRKCMHCEITRTPQWRAGPMGSKTLCNACGVRYKLGRLFPEYRPAASPTFVPSLHSNSHKKVLEMRTKAPTVASSPTMALTKAQPELVPNIHPCLDYT